MLAGSHSFLETTSNSGSVSGLLCIILHLNFSFYALGHFYLLEVILVGFFRAGLLSRTRSV